MTEYVVGFMFEESSAPERVLLIEKRRPAWQANRLNGIGGKIEDGEFPLQALVREFREETGLETELHDWREFASLTDRRGWLVRFYRAFGPIDLARNASDEPVMIVTTWALPTHVLTNLRWLIPLALDTNLSLPVVLEEIAQAKGSPA